MLGALSRSTHEVPATRSDFGAGVSLDWQSVTERFSGQFTAAVLNLDDTFPAKLLIL
jgi:hypothetical protein